MSLRVRQPAKIWGYITFFGNRCLNQDFRVWPRQLSKLLESAAAKFADGQDGRQRVDSCKVNIFSSVEKAGARYRRTSLRLAAI